MARKPLTYTEHIQTRVTPEMLYQIFALARREDVPVAEVLRRAIWRYLDEAAGA